MSDPCPIIANGVLKRGMPVNVLVAPSSTSRYERLKVIVNVVDALFQSPVTKLRSYAKIRGDSGFSLFRF